MKLRHHAEVFAGCWTPKPRHFLPCRLALYRGTGIRPSKCILVLRCSCSVPVEVTNYFLYRRQLKDKKLSIARKDLFNYSKHRILGIKFQSSKLEVQSSLFIIYSSTTVELNFSIFLGCIHQISLVSTICVPIWVK